MVAAYVTGKKVSFAHTTPLTSQPADQKNRNGNVTVYMELLQINAHVTRGMRAIRAARTLALRTSSTSVVAIIYYHKVVPAWEKTQEWMYYGPGTAGRCCIYAPGRPFLCTHQMAAIFLREITSWSSSWKCDVKSKIGLCQNKSMHIYVNNIAAKFHLTNLKQRSIKLFLKMVSPARTRTTTKTITLKNHNVVKFHASAHLVIIHYIRLTRPYTLNLEWKIPKHFSHEIWWDALPIDFRDETCTAAFKQKLKTFYFSQAFDCIWLYFIDSASA